MNSKQHNFTSSCLFKNSLCQILNLALTLINFLFFCSWVLSGLPQESSQNSAHKFPGLSGRCYSCVIRFFIITKLVSFPDFLDSYIIASIVLKKFVKCSTGKCVGTSASICLWKKVLLSTQLLYSLTMNN